MIVNKIEILKLNNEKENLKSALNQITKERDMLKQLIETAHIEQKKIEKLLKKLIKLKKQNKKLGN